MVPAHNKGVPLGEIVKGTDCFLNVCFLMLVAEHIDFDAYMGTAIISLHKQSTELMCLASN